LLAGGGAVVGALQLDDGGVVAVAILDLADAVALAADLTGLAFVGMAILDLADRAAAAGPVLGGIPAGEAAHLGLADAADAADLADGCPVALAVLVLVRAGTAAELLDDRLVRGAGLGLLGKVVSHCRAGCDEQDGNCERGFSEHVRLSLLLLRSSFLVSRGPQRWRTCACWPTPIWVTRV